MTLAEKKQLVARFLARCNEYADAKLEGYHTQARAERGPEALSLADKISHWSAYRAFNEHTIAELETSRLDSWFDSSFDSSFD